MNCIPSNISSVVQGWYLQSNIIATEREKIIKYAIGLLRQLYMIQSLVIIPCGVTHFNYFCVVVWEICNLCLIEFIAPLSERERRKRSELQETRISWFETSNFTFKTFCDEVLDLGIVIIFFWIIHIYIISCQILQIKVYITIS